MILAHHTIFALATPLAKSGVAVVRISGAAALPCLRALTGKQDWEPNKFTYSLISYPSSLIPIDHALCVYFKAPKSFTGEDVVEIHCHGSLAVIRELLGALSSFPDLRPAERGEFTRRAFLNGKMDMLEVEGLADLIDAETSAQKSQALRQMQGEMSGFYERLRSAIISTLAHMEAYIDFPDEEIPESVLSGMDDEVRGVQQIIKETLGQHAKGERIREGINIVILGAPNAGKSSLLNCLAGREAAIVSHHAGTTRDLIEVHMDIAGFPVILVDTAGLRDSDNDIEVEGIKRAKARAENADIKLVLFDGTAEPDAESLALVDANTITIATKCDLIPLTTHHLPLSTKTGQGLDELINLLETRIREQFSGEGAVITRERHRHELIQSEQHLQRFFGVKELELKCEELRIAAGCIAKITGKIAVDDVLDVVFREFCIGK